MKGGIMRIIINHSSMIPIYEQIVDQIKKQINDHILQENDPLPSVRLLSKELRISALTVKKAYDTLEEEVLTKTIHGKGTFVLAVNKDLLEEAKKEIEEYLEKALQKAKQSGVSHKEVKELLELLMEE
jgi:GntR family transcriptional regulator